VKRCGIIAIRTTGALSVAAIQKRRFTLRSSLSSSASVGITGSSAIPQIGQWPGPTWRICGCIGQV
jgi:hypothetical protein